MWQLWEIIYSLRFYWILQDLCCLCVYIHLAWRFRLLGFLSGIQPQDLALSFHLKFLHDLRNLAWYTTFCVCCRWENWLFLREMVPVLPWLSTLIMAQDLFTWQTICIYFHLEYEKDNVVLVIPQYLKRTRAIKWNSLELASRFHVIFNDAYLHRMHQALVP